MSFPLFADVASYQPSDQTWFQNLKNQGVLATVVKVTEGSADGTNYVNPKASAQIVSALNVGMQAHCYHFARFTSITDAKNEASFFVQQVKARGMDATTILVVDIESSDLTHDPQALTEQINAFIQVVKAAGYPRTDIYSSASWFNAPRFYRAQLIPRNCWVASYGTTKPGVENVGAWQFTDNFNSLNVDMSYDFNGFYTGAVKKTTSAKPAKPAAKVSTYPGFQAEKGTFTVGDTAIQVRVNGVGLKAQKGGKLQPGDQIVYDGFSNVDGFIWLHYKGKTGDDLFVPSHPTGAANNVWGIFK